MIKVLDLFSGIGGFSHALDNIEVNGEKVFETVAFCEWDKDAQKVLKKHWPDVPLFCDVNKLVAAYLRTSDTHFLYEDKTEFTQARGGKSLRINIDELKYEGKIDMIVGGFPCTDISTAGKQKGFVDEHGERTRSGLWFEYRRLIEEIKPRWVVIENVGNLRSKGLGVVLKDLWELGYNAEWEVISARSIGACHLRQRIWIVAYPNGGGLRNESEWRQPKKSEQDEPGTNGEAGTPGPSDSDDFRFWPSFTSEETKSEWWAEATSSERCWWETQSPVRGMDDAVPEQLDEGSSGDRETLTLEKRAHEKARQARLKQLGNAIVPGIARIIGRRIAYHERDELSLL